MLRPVGRSFAYPPIIEGLMSEGIVPRPVKNEDDQLIDLEKAHQVSRSNSSSQACRCEQTTDRSGSPRSPLPISNRTRR